MEASESKRSVVVGIFVFLGIILFVAGIFTLAGQQKRFVKSININAIFDNVAGLKIGNNVWFSGVKIGTVKKIDFYGSSQVKILMNVEEEAQKYIHKNATAQISSEGIIGNRIIVINGGSLNLPNVESGDRIGVKKALDTDKMMEDLQANNKNLIDITGNLSVITTRMVEGKGSIGALLTDSSIALNLRSTMAGLSKASNNINNTAVSLSAFSNKLNHKGGLVDKLLTDTEVFSQLQSSVGEIKKLSVAAASLSNDLTTAGAKLNDKDNAIGVLLNDQETAESLKKTMLNLESSSAKLDDNMEALQHNFLLKGYFKKKAKEEAKEEK
ncbi:VpsC protein [Arcticibacter svalbardensis MN12-7]|uniref:VpsC protein n=1 Tax=Arcticibacter svalbardensis MN12-7 TaxID=1150600 RepID=R9GW48_9SPHI|nr:MlaD family protein [Arcticibacter svalbardensis]EOR95898.1 VpsC protein [Arcticibacter svalbardensis MN12-7]